LVKVSAKARFENIGGALAEQDLSLTKLVQDMVTTSAWNYRSK